MSLPIDQDPTDSITGEAHSGHPQPSSGGLFSSAKIVADAAQSAYRRESFDKAKAAGAAEDILGAASTYGKFDEKGYGKYVDQAEDYLHQIRGDGGSVKVKPSEGVKSEEPAEEKPAEEKEQGKLGEPVEPVEEKPVKEKEEGKSGGGGGGGYGDYMKMAEGFVQKYPTETETGEEVDGKTKESGKEEESSGGGYGNYMKMAEGFVQNYQTETETKEEVDGKTKESGKEEPSSGGGYGNYFKMAEGFLKK